jgi:hypothetical protein
MLKKTAESPISKGFVFDPFEVKLKKAKIFLEKISSSLSLL